MNRNNLKNVNSDKEQSGKGVFWKGELLKKDSLENRKSEKGQI